MDRLVRAVVLIVAVLTPFASANARAFASVTLDSGSASSYDTGFAFTYQDFEAMLGPGQSETFSLHYTVSLASDGFAMPVEDMRYNCLPIHNAVCGPPWVVGTEAAQADVLFAAEGRYGINAFINFNVTGGEETALVHGSHYSEGIISFTATNQDTFSSRPMSAFIFGAVFVNASPIPEPGLQIMFLAGLAALGAIGSRRSRGAAVSHPTAQETASARAA